MKKTLIAFAALLGLALVNNSALAQHALEYNPYTKDAETVRNVEQQWADAMLKHDATALQTILRDDFTEVAQDGKSHSKADQIGLLQSPEFKVDSFNLQNVNVRVYQGGAIVTGSIVTKGKSKGVEFGGQYRFTDVFEPKNNNWQAVWRQLTKVEEEKPAK
jgi:ketosteroid isomerase-like protein